MKTVKDVSEISGVSIRTLRYYDEIGLLNPTELSDAGYRLYDSKALETVTLRESQYTNLSFVPAGNEPSSRACADIWLLQFSNTLWPASGILN